MDWKRALEEERTGLMRLVALLYSLARLAQLADRRSPAVRGFVLWILRHAEAMARDFVTGDPGTPPVSVPVVPAGGRPADAMRLVISFRALARRLDRQARLLLAARRAGSAETDLPPAGRLPAIRDIFDALASIAALTGRAYAAHPAPDTS